MDCFYNVCDKTNKTKSKSKCFQSLKHNDFDKWIWTKQTMKNTDLFDIDEIVYKYITNHKRLFGLSVVKNDFG